MALIPQFFPDCVVALGIHKSDGDIGWVASGFFYGHYVFTDGKGQKRFLTYLVTNRHVVTDSEKMVLRCNPREGKQAEDYELDLIDESGTASWFAPDDPEVDIAVVLVDFPMLTERGMQVSFFHNDEHSANIEKLIDLEITEGDFAYVLGFPMGLVSSKERNTVIVRSGTIARIRDVLDHTSSEFLIDAFIFPGNSGGPVVSKPEALAIRGTKPQNAAYLIGVIRSYVPYRDVAISQQSGRPRVVFEENSGLALAHPVDFIEEAVSKHLENESKKAGKSLPQWLEDLSSG